MYAAERQQRILAGLETAGRVEVTLLANDLDVTTETIRRDLANLESRGLLRRVHGGALPARPQGFEPRLSRRAEEHVAEKNAIAQSAARLIDQSVRSVVLDAGSSTEALAALLPDVVAGRDLTVVTNSLPIAASLADVTGIHLHLLGGRVRHRTMAAVGQSCVEQLGHLCVDIAFMGANGVHPRHGLTTPDAQEADAKRAMTRAADSVVALTDSSKLGQSHLCRIVELSKVDTIVTDGGADQDVLDDLSAAGPEVLVA